MITRALLTVALCLLVGACDDGQGDSVASTRPATQPERAASIPPRPPDAPTRADLASVAILAPNRPTHLAITPAGKVFFCQQSRDGRDLVMSLSATDLPEPTALSTATIIEAIGEKNITGNIAALCAARDGNLYFYFVGGAKKRPVYAVGQYNTRTARIRIFCDLPRIERASGMGASLELTTGELVATQSHLWLWLRHLDESVMLSFELSRLSAGGMIDPRRPFTEVRCGTEVLPMNRPEYRLSPGTGEEMLLVDAWTGGVFRLNARGQAALVSTLIALPREMSHAAPLDPARVIVFAAEGEPIVPRSENRLDGAGVETTFPALLVFHEGKITPIPATRVTARPGLPVYALRLERIVREPRGTYIAFDSASGELLRLTLMP